MTSRKAHVSSENSEKQKANKKKRSRNELN